MSMRTIERAQDGLEAALRKAFPVDLTGEEDPVPGIMEALEALVAVVVQDRLDAENGRGVYAYD